MTIGKANGLILVDNLAGEGLIAEHGLSVWIEAGGRRILFDTGQGDALEANARTLGVDLGETDILVLSHGHYDHTGGVSGVLARAPGAEVFCHPAAVQPRYSLRGGRPKAVHMPEEDKRALEGLPAQRLHFVSRPVWLAGHIGLTGFIPRETDYEDTGGAFYLDPAGKHVDPIEDDMALWIHTPFGLVVLLGCSHAGLVNTLNHVKRLSGISTVYAVIGGFHLVHSDENRLRQTINALRLMQPCMIAACHCTGEPFVHMLRDVFGSRLLSCRSGMRYGFG